MWVLGIRTLVRGKRVAGREARMAKDPSHPYSPFSLSLSISLSLREWIVTQHKDTYASFLGHPNLRAYVSLASSECMERTRVKLIEVRQ